MTGWPPEVRFAKHRLLPEIGPAGQARLSASHFTLEASDPAAQFAAELLERSGLTRAADGTPLSIAPSREPDAAFSEVDAAVRGAIAAVDEVRRVVGVRGAPLTLAPKTAP